MAVTRDRDATPESHIGITVNEKLQDVLAQLRSAEAVLRNISSTIVKDDDSIGMRKTESTSLLHNKIDSLEFDLRCQRQKFEEAESLWSAERIKLQEMVRDLHNRNEILECQLSESRRVQEEMVIDSKNLLPLPHKSPELVALSQSTSVELNDMNQLDDHEENNHYGEEHEEAQNQQEEHREDDSDSRFGNPDDTMLSTSSTPESSPSKQAGRVKELQRNNFLTSRSAQRNVKVLGSSSTSNILPVRDDDALKILSQGGFSLSQPRTKIELLLHDENKENWDDEPTISDSEPEYEDYSHIIHSTQLKLELKKEEEGEDFSSEDESLYFDTNDVLSQLLQSRKEQSQSKSNILDLTRNPIKGREWYPEDFKINPVTNFNRDYAFKHRKLDAKFVHPAIKEQFQYTKKFTEEKSLSAFNQMTGGDPTLPSPGISMVWSTPISNQPSKATASIGKQTRQQQQQLQLMTPLRTPQSALSDPKIDPVFKFNIDSTTIPGKVPPSKDNQTMSSENFSTPKQPNRTKYSSVFADPNNIMLPSIASRTVKLWERPPSPPGFSRSDFPSTQEREDDKAEADRLCKIKSLKRLFQATMMVESSNEDTLKHVGGDEKEDDNDDDVVVYRQVGKFIFKNEELNRAIVENRFTIDESIFYDHTKV